MTAAGLVTATLPFSNVDGPGNRFVVFLQGCTFDCLACHNPYTIGVCDDCGLCVDACDAGALTLVDGRVAWTEAACTGAEACLAVCPVDASPKARWRAVADLLPAVRRAAPFLSGVTVSGGEATRQAGFVRALFAAVKADPELARLTCFVDSNGDCPPATWAALASVTDGAMIDLKCLDPALHVELTGRANDAVLASIRCLHDLGRLYEVRLLLVAGRNDDAALLERTARWLAGVDPAMRVKLIAFRPHGARPADPPLATPDAAAMERAAALFRSAAAFDVCVV